MESTNSVDESVGEIKTEKRNDPCKEAVVSSIESDDDDHSSIFSASFSRFVPNDEDDASSLEEEEEECFRAQLEELEKYLKKRLDFIESVPSPLRPSLLRWERWSSRLRRNTLFSSASNESVTNEYSQPSDHDLPESSHLRRLYEDTLLECYTFLPAATSLFCHCAAMIAIYDLVIELLRNLLHRIQRLVSFTSYTAWVESGSVDTFFYATILCLGLGLLHSSGYLYWWLSPRDYFLLKFDARNRRGDLDVRIVAWVRRQSPMVRLVLYMLGYCMVYMVATVLLSCTFLYFSQQKTLLPYLPSQTFRMDLYEPVGTFTPALFCKRSCSEEIERRQSAFNELLHVEREYTRRALDKTSYKMYWHTWTYSWGNVYDLDTGEYAMVDLASTPLFDFTGEIVFAAFFFLLGVGVLRWYGFVFWEKY